jgi:CHASE1-domain containing sensor protein
MLIYVPVFERQPASATEKEPSSLVGYVTAVVTLDSLVSAMRKKVEQMGIDVLVFDNTNKTHQLLAYLPSQPSELNAEDAATKYRIAKDGFVLRVDIAGRDWEFVMHPNQPAYDNDKTLISALMASLLLISVLALWATRRRMSSVADSAGA